MKPDETGLGRRSVLSLVGAGGLAALGGAKLLSSDSPDYNRVTYAQTQQMQADLRVDWLEKYNGTTLEDQDQPTDDDGKANLEPVITLDNVMPGDSGLLQFGLSFDTDNSSASEAIIQMRIRLFDTSENGLTEPEQRAGDAGSDGGELQDYVEVQVWNDSGITMAGTPIHNACDGELNSGDTPFLQGDLATVSSDSWTTIPTSDDADCVPIDDGLCVALSWALPDDLPGVNDNVVQSDRVEFEIAFRAAECQTS